MAVCMVLRRKRYGTIPLRCFARLEMGVAKECLKTSLSIASDAQRCALVRVLRCAPAITLLEMYGGAPTLSFPARVPLLLSQCIQGGSLWYALPAWREPRNSTVAVQTGHQVDSKQLFLVSLKKTLWRLFEVLGPSKQERTTHFWG